MSEVSRRKGAEHAHENTEQDSPSNDSQANTIADAAQNGHASTQRVNLQINSAEDSTQDVHAIIQAAAAQVLEELQLPKSAELTITETFEQEIRAYSGPLPHAFDMAMYDQQTKDVTLSEFVKDGKARRSDNSKNARNYRINATLERSASAIILLVLILASIYLFTTGNVSGGVLSAAIIFLLTFATWLFEDGISKIAKFFRRAN